MRIVVVGGGFGGMAAAARLAKLGHDVVVFEASDRLGGAIGYVEAGGFRWDAGPTRTLLPAVIRDLFRKSGRPAEREIELVPADPTRHVFEDGTELDLPSGSRGAQIRAIDAALGSGRGEMWADFVASYADDWEALRKDWFERPYDPAHAGRRTKALLGSRKSLQRAAGRLPDRRLRALAIGPAILAGQDPATMPAWTGLDVYLEQNFGVWTVPGGMGALADVLANRLTTRKVRVETGAPVENLLGDPTRIRGVVVGGEPVAADAVVVAIDPRRLPLLADATKRTDPVTPPRVTHVGIVGGVPDLPGETVLHGPTPVVVRTGGQAPEGAHAWTLIGDDPMAVLRRLGSDAEVVEQAARHQWAGSPYGVRWQGRRTLRDRVGNRGPYPGLYLAGAHTTPGAGLPGVGLSASIVAQLIGRA